MLAQHIKINTKITNGNVVIGNVGLIYNLCRLTIFFFTQIYLKQQKIIDLFR